MSKRKRPSQRVRVSGQHPPFPRRAELWMALGLTALAPGPTLAAFPANIELSALDGTNGFSLSGAAAGDFSGRAVSTAGDVNGDGVDDLLIGAVGADPNGDYSGASYVVFGQRTPPIVCDKLPLRCDFIPAGLLHVPTTPASSRLRAGQSVINFGLARKDGTSAPS